MSTTEETIKAIETGVTLTGDIAVTVAPIVAMYNPAIGAALQLLAPVVTKFILNETQIVLEFSTEMTKEEVIAALKKSKSDTWNLTPLV